MISSYPRSRPSLSACFLLVALMASSCGAATPRAEESPVARAHSIESQGCQVHYLEAGARVAGKPSVLLLHGARFSSRTWAELGTLETLAGAGHHVIALDLPGFGASTGEPPVDRSAFLNLLLEELDIDPVALLAPSMSGSYAIPFLVEYPERVSHFFAVAPVGIADNLEALRQIEVPTLALWGKEDQVIPVQTAEDLTSALPNAELRVFPAATHPCYLDATAEFHAAVLDFLER